MPLAPKGGFLNVTIYLISPPLFNAYPFVLSGVSNTPLGAGGSYSLFSDFTGFIKAALID